MRERATLALLLVGVLSSAPPGWAHDTEIPEDDPTVAIALGDAERGRAAVERYGCGVCHRISNLPGAIGIVGPSLDGFARRPLIAGTLPNEGGLLVRFIANPPGLVPGTAMPAIDMDDREVRDIAAFLATLD